MQISSINNANFGRNRNLSNEQVKRLQEDALLNLSEQDIQNISHFTASIQADDEGYRKKQNALLISLPLLYGARDGLFAKKPSLLDGKLKGPAARVAIASTVAASWLGMMGIVGGTFKVADFMAKKDDSIGEFNRKYPVMSTLATLAASIGACFLGVKGVEAMLGKISSKNVDKIINKTSEYSDKFNESKFVKGLQKRYNKLTKNTTDGVKEVARGAAWYAPVVLFFAALINPFVHAAKKSQLAQANSAEIHNAQKQIISERMQALQDDNESMANAIYG